MGLELETLVDLKEKELTLLLGRNGLISVVVTNKG